MKNILLVFFLLFIVYSDLSAYVDMSDVRARARDLDMRFRDYTFVMALSGVISAGIFGIFLWKVK